VLVCWTGANILLQEIKVPNLFCLPWLAGRY
jgi:hypothetical protein